MIATPLWLTCLLAAQPARVTFVDPPPALVEATEATVTLAYEIPADLGRVPLRCELKNPAHGVLVSQQQPVAGAGRATFRFRLPAAATTAEILFAAWLGTDWQQSLCPIVHTPPVRLISAAEGERLAAQRLAAGDLARRLTAARGARGLVAFWEDPATDLTPGLTEALAASLATAGYGTVRLEREQMANPFALGGAGFDLLVVADASRIPATAASGLAQFLTVGGRLACLGGRAFDRATWSWGGQWLERPAYQQAVARGVRATVLRDFETDDRQVWPRSTNSRAHTAEVKWQAGGANGSAGCQLIELADLTGWETFEVPGLSRPFPAGHSWTCFWARGDETTPELAVEWRETDGSRWIAVVPLAAEWQPYVLPPEAFVFWSDSASAGRGGAGDVFRPAHADKLVFGLAHSHTKVGGGPHRIWLDNLGTAPADPTVELPVLFGQRLTWPVIEFVSPGYKLYDVTNAVALRPEPTQVLVGELAAPCPTSLLAPHPRPGGSGFDKRRPERFIPLLESVDAAGRVTGAAVALATFPNGGRLLTAPVTDPAFFAHPATRAWLAEALRTTLERPLLTEAGAAWYACFPGETVPLGARLTASAPELSLDLTVTEPGGHVVWRNRWERVEAAQQSAWTVPDTAAGAYRVEAVLRRGEQALDRLTHDLTIVRPKAVESFVTVQDGSFQLAGRRWRPHGINYMPSTGIAREAGEGFEYWLDPAPYDPVYIERDLTDIAALGLNSVSVFIYYRSLDSHNLLDLLARCERHGLKVNLSLRPGTPLDFRWEEMRALVERHRLAHNDTVFAYDLAWEPTWGRAAERRRWDAAWREWLTARYGSVAAAETAWGCPANRVDGQVVGPTDEQLGAEGPWTPLAVDYHRFLNDLLDRHYGRARELLRSIAPKQLVSFRMNSAADPTRNPAWVTYDFAGLRRAVDFLGPEGYGRIGDWEKVKPGWFTTAYARAVCPELPVVWTEFGHSVWDRGAMAVPPANLEFQARFYDDFYKMVDLSGADGTYCWWFPGGYRVGERSDFGILNPDRSRRPVSDVIARWAARLTAPEPRPTPDELIPIRLERHATGVVGLYREVGERFWRAVEAGRRPGLKVE